MTVLKTRCCCDCCTVRTGTIILGILSLISSGYQVLGRTLNLVQLSDSVQSLIGNYSSNPELQEWFNNHETLLYIGLCLAILVYLINFILSLLLLYGVHKNDESKCLPWLYYNIFMYIWSLIYAVLITIFLFIVSPLIGIGLAIFYAMIFLVAGYYLNVVRHYILGLREARNNPGTARPGNEGKVYYTGSETA